ncbi:MAG: hypothetical protein P8P30_01495 [Rickettsiales bacterium]|nr:hypothetical protein [Rickettsiales bacterium]
MDTKPLPMKKQRIALGVVAVIFFTLIAIAFYAWFFSNPIYPGPRIIERAKEAQQIQQLTIIVSIALSLLVMLLRHWLAKQIAKFPYLMDVIIAFIILVEALSHGLGLPIPHSHAWLEILIPYFSATRGGRWFILHTHVGKWVLQTANSCHQIRWKNWMVKLAYIVNTPLRIFWHYWAKNKPRSD